MEELPWCVVPADSRAKPSSKACTKLNGESLHHKDASAVRAQVANRSRFPTRGF